jgi:PAS domain S-box-containing protein
MISSTSSTLDGKVATMPPTEPTRRFRFGIRAQIVVPLVILMLLSLIGSAIGFIWNTNTTRNQILDTQLNEDLQRLETALISRQEDVREASRLLTNESIRAALISDQVLDLDQEAVPVRDRFNISQIIIVNQQGQARINLATTANQTALNNRDRSNLIAQVSPNQVKLVQIATGKFIVSRSDILDETPGNPPIGQVYALIDLQQDIQRLVVELGLVAETQLALNQSLIAATDRLVNSQIDPAINEVLLNNEPYRVLSRRLLLGGENIQLAVARSEQAFNAINASGLRSLLISSLVTWLILLLLGLLLAQTFLRPILYLNRVALSVAGGNLSRRTNMRGRDEIGELGWAFDHATERIVGLLEDKSKVASELQSTLQSIADGVLAVDREGRIVQLNPTAAIILGQRVDRLLHQSVEILRPPASQPEKQGIDQVVDVVLSELDDTDISSTSMRLMIGDRTVRVRSAPIVGEQRTIYGAVVVLQDITREVEAERAKTEFIGIASHELRTPLTGVRGHIDLMFLLDQGRLSDDQKESLDAIRRQTNRLTELVNQMLEMASIDQEQGRVSGVPVSPIDTVIQALHSVRDEAHTRQISFVRDFEAELPLILVDPGHLQKILTNLLSNAVRYGHDGGSVAIRVYRLDDLIGLPSPPIQATWPYNSEESVMIEIHDNGVGIRAADQANMFKRFFRSANSRSVLAGGTGLGLAITRALVQLNGGQIGFRSTEGVGSCFWVRFPTLTLTQGCLKEIARGGELVRS